MSTLDPSQEQTEVEQELPTSPIANDRHLLIDADSLAYKIAHFHNQSLAEGPGELQDDEVDDEDEFVGEAADSLAWAENAVNLMLSQWMKLNHCATYEFHLTAGVKLAEVFKEKYKTEARQCFRYEESQVLPDEYKANRAAVDPVPGAEDVLKVMATRFNSFIHDNIEADDAVVALKQLANQRGYGDKVILAAIDKDVLNQASGVHFNYHRLEPHVVSEEQAIRYPYWQCLVGDPADGYKGVPGVGKVKADKLLTTGMSQTEMWAVVLGEFKRAGMTEDHAIATMRLANMRQVTADRGKVKTREGTAIKNVFHLRLWTPPTE